MDSSDIVIIGGVAAGPKTAATVARRLPQARITLFQRERYISYGSCGLPYFASGDIDSFNELTYTAYRVARDADFFRQSKGVDVETGREVVSIDRENKTVTVVCLEDGSRVEHGYGTLVLATGAVPKAPPFPVADSDRIRPFTRPDDAMSFRRMAEQGQVGSVMIVGGGFIGCELAEAAGGLWGMDVTLVDREDRVLSHALDREMAEIVHRELSRRGVCLLTGHDVVRVDSRNDRPVTAVQGHGDIETDYAFVCVGVQAESSLARECGLEIGPCGGIVVDDHMRTSDPNIFAGGDCVESIHRIGGGEIYMPLGSLANRHGRVIAENIAGNDVVFPGVLGAFLIKVFDVNAGAVGLTERAAVNAGIPARAVWGSFVDKPDYYPEAKNFTAKLVYSPENARLLGLQAAGPGDIARRIDVFSSFLQRRAGLNDLLDFEHGYAPPFAEALDPLHHLAAMALAQEKGISFVSPAIDVTGSNGDVQFLDVREATEREADPFESSGTAVVPIPLNELRRRLGELDSSLRTIIVCHRGPRSYQAARILQDAGFRCVDILAGGLQSRQG